MKPIYVDFLNGPDIAALALTDDEILDAIEHRLAVQGQGQAVIEPRTHLKPDPAVHGPFQRAARRAGSGVGVAGVKVVVAAVLLVFGMTSASAEMDAKTLLRDYDSASSNGQRYLRDIVSSTENGISWANSDLDDRRLYCQPGKLSLTGEQLVDMVRQEVAAHPFAADFPIGLVIRESLKETFPCSQRAN